MRRLSVVFIIPACAIASLVLLLALFSITPVSAFPTLADRPAPESVGAAADDLPIKMLAEPEGRTAGLSEADRLTRAEARMTALAPNAPAATLEVQVNYAHDWVAGVTDPQDPGITVVVTVTNGAGDLKADAEVTAETSGDYFVGCNDWWAGECPDIVPGDIVKVYAEGLVNEINPVGAIPGELDAASNMVTAWLHADWFADPLNVSCEVWEDPGPSPIYTTATTNGGEFQCDFTGSWDLEPFQMVAVRYYEPDGDQVINILQWPWVQVNFGHDWVGATYYLGHTFWVTVTDSLGSVRATATVDTASNGSWGGDGFQTQDWQWDPEQPDIIPGDFVYYRADDGYTNVVEVGDINATLELSADTVGGTIQAPFGISLTVDCHPWGAWDAGMGWVPTKQDLVYPDGADPFLCDWGSGGEWDILPGQDIGVIYTEPDGDNVVNVVREPAAFLRVYKWSDGEPAEGGNFPYHISYENIGDATAENVQIVDTMVGGISYLSNTSGLPRAGVGAGPITWDIGTLNPGEGGGFDLFVAVTASAGEWISNTAAIETTSYNQGYPDYQSATWENEVLPNDTHLNVGKSAWTGDPAPGHDFIYNVNVCNNGSTGSTEVTLEDNLQQPTLVFQDWWAQHPGWYEVYSDAGQLIVANPSIPSHSCGEVYLRVLLDGGANPGDYLSNQALITAGNDIETDDNEAWWEGNANEPHLNLQIDKWWNGGQLYPGGELRYGVGYNNTGNVPVGPVLITETFPTGTSFVSAWHNDPYGSYDFPPAIVTPDYAVWELSTLENGYGGNFEVLLAIDPGALPGDPLVNQVEIVRLPGEDTHEDNESVWVEYLNTPGPNLRVTKYYDWQDGEWLNYQIHFENIGDETISDVLVTDDLLNGQQWGGWWHMDFDWSRLVSDNQSPSTLSWQFSELYPGESGWLYFNATVPDPGVPLRWYTNTVEITIPPLEVNPDDNWYDTLAFSGPEVRRVEFWLNPYGDSNMWGEAAPGLVVTVTNPFGTQYTTWADPNCGGCWNIDNIGPLDPGDIVMVEAGEGIQPVLVTIPLVDVGVDAAADEVFGQIVPWESRPVEVHGNWPDGYREASSDVAGNFLAAYPDIPRGGNGYVRFIDYMDMAEVIFHRPFYALDLVLDVNYGHDWIEGVYEPGHTIWITLTESDGSTVKGVAELTTDYPPDWEQPGFATWWNGWLGDQPNLMPYDWVYAKADNGVMNAVQVGEIDFNADYGADLVSGNLFAAWVPDPPVYLECQIWSGGGAPNVGDMVDPNGGAFLCDYGAIPWDIQPGETVAVSYWDDDGDRIINTYDWPRVTLSIGPWSGGDRQVWGSGGTPNSSVAISVTDEFGAFLEGTVASTDEWGNFDTAEALSEGILAFWNIVEVDFGGDITDTVTVYPMGGEANPDTDVITITAAGPSFFSIQLEVCNHQEGWCDWYDLGNIGEAGNIEVDMMAQFGFDVGWGQTFYAHMYVWRGHEVRYAWALPAPELNVYKWHSGNYARPGGVAVYGIQYRNDGNGPAENTILVDTLPPFLSYADDTSGVAAEVGPGGLITWYLGTVQPGEQRSFMVTLDVDPGAPTGPGALDQNCVEISTSSEGDWNPDNNWHCTTPTDLWNDDVEMSVDKWAQPWDPTPGQEFEYHVQWCNHRGAAAGRVVLTDTLPVGVTLLEWWPQDWNELYWHELAFSPNELVLYAPGLPGDYCENITLRVLLEPDVETGAVLDNLVVLDVADDVDPSNNWRLQDGAQASPPRYDLWVQKVWDNNSVVVPGGYIGFSIDYSNNGNVETTVRITDTLPPGLSYSHGWWGSHTPWESLPFPDPTIIGNQLIWDLPAIPVNAGYGFNIELNIDGGAEPTPELVNCATAAAEGPDDTPEDNSACAGFPINPPGPNLEVTKQHNWNGDGQLNYEIRFANIGDQPVDDVWTIDTLPPGTQWDGWWDMGFDWGRLIGGDVLASGDQLLWNFSDLQPGERGWIQFNANLDNPGEPLRWYENVVDITIPDGETTPDDNHHHDVAFSGGEVTWLEVEVNGTAIRGYAPQGPIVITTPYEEDILPWDGDFDWNLDNELWPGDMLTITAGAGLAPVTLVIPDPFDVEGSSISDRVSGQIDHLDQEWINVNLHGGLDMNAQTDSNGFFDVLFPDIPRGGQGEVNYTTEVDYTSVNFYRHWQSPDLILEVRLFDSLVEGRYPVGHTVWITVTEGDGVTVKGAAELTTHYFDPWGDTGFSTNDGWLIDPGQIVPGDWVYARADNGFASEVQVFDISGSVDVDTDSIEGFVDAPWYVGIYDPMEVQCHPWGAWNQGWNDVEVKNSSASADGATTPYFCQWDPAAEWDVDYGQDIGVWVPDEDGDYVFKGFQAETVELGVWKWHQGNYARPSGVMVYGIYYQNNGSAPAENVQIVETLPANTTYADDTGGFPVTIGPGNQVTWDLGTVEAGQSEFIYVTLNVDPGLSEGPGAIEENCVAISSSTTPDLDPSNDQNCADLVDVWQDDVELGVDKWAHPGDPTPGQPFRYELQWCNNRGAAAGPVVLTDTLPAEVNYLTWREQDDWQHLWNEVSFDGTNLVLYAPGLPGDECRNIEVYVELDPGTPIGTPLVNMAELAVEGDVDLSNNWIVQETQASPPRYDLGISKRFHNGSIVPGGFINYIIDYRNNGNTASGVTITETVPPGLTYNGSWWGGNLEDELGPLPEPTIVGDLLVWQLGELPLDINRWIHVEMLIDGLTEPGTEFGNCVEISGEGPDDWPEDNVACETVAINPSGPNLAVSKRHDWENSDNHLAYEVTLFNLGDELAFNVVLTDTYPAGTAAANDPSWDHWGNVHVIDDTANNQWIFVIEELYPGDMSRFYFSVNLDNPGEPARWYTNIAEVPILPGETDASDNYYEDVAFSGGEVRRVEFWLNEYGSSSMWGEAVPGATVIITTEHGIFTTWADPGCGGCWSVDDAGLIEPGDVIDVVAGDRIIPVVITIPDPIAAEVDTATGEIFGQIGGWSNMPVQIHGNWPGGYQEVGTDGAGNYLASYPDMPRGADGYIRFSDAIDFAEVVFHREFYSLDLVLEVNYGHDWVEGLYEPGHTIWITVTESDGTTVKGLAELYSDPIDDWGGQSGFSTNYYGGWLGGHVDLQPGDWVLGRVDNGQTAEVRLGAIDGVLDVDADTVDLTFTVPWFSDPLPASCTVWKPNGPGLEFLVDPNGGTHLCDFTPTGWDLQPGDDVGVSYLGPDGHRVYNVFVEPAPYLYIRKYPQGEPGEGGNLAFRIEYGNQGGTTAEEVTITDVLGPGMVYVGDTSGVAHTGSGSGPISWDLGGVDPGFDSFFDVFVELTVGASEPISNVIFISTTNPFNQSGPEETESGWEGVVQENDTHLNVGKWAWTDDPAPDQNVIFSMNVCNDGSTGSSEVTLTDDLHPALSLVDWWSRDNAWQEVSRGSQQLVLSRLTAPGHWCEEVLIEAHVDPAVQAGETLSNTATIAAANDLETGDNVATWESQAADPHHNLLVYKWWQRGQLVPGGQLVYHIRVRNTGNVPVGSFTVTDTLPVMTTFQESWLNEPGGESPLIPAVVASDYVLWTFGGLGNGEWIDFDVYVTVDPDAQPGTTLINTAEVTRLPGEDDHEDNIFQDTQTLNPPGPNLRVQKWHGWQSPQTLGYTIKFENIGTENIADFWVTDTLPEGLGWDGWWNTSMDDERQLDFVPLPGSLAWHFGGLQAGEVGFIDFSASMLNPEGPAPVYSNTVEITIPPGDVNSDDNVYVDEAILEAGLLWIEPALAPVPVGDTVTVDVMVANINDLYGAALEISFDPALLAVVDADGGEAGVQIGAGSCPAADFVVQNTADNGSGVINYDVISLNPTLPCDGGGLVAQITFQALAAGASPVHFNSQLLSNTSAEAVVVSTQDGAIEVSALTTVNGLVGLQSRTDHSGAEVCADDGARQVTCVTTDAAGAYELWLPDGTYTVTVSFERYLDGEQGGVVVASGSPVSLPKVKLLGGDANDDGIVNILDLSFMGARFGMSCGEPGWDGRADINSDCTINILDLSVAGGNYSMTCPVPWP